MLTRAAVIIVLGFIAYGFMLPSPFRVMDDRISIVENAAIKSVKNIPGIFREGYFHDQSYYRPLINLSFMGEYRLFGLNSFFYNLDNLILHILNALLVFLLVSRLTNSDTTGFWTGLLFVIHPVQWEAVCNVPGRAILLSAFFTLSSFLLFLEFYKNRRAFFGFLVLVVFSLGLLCKESAGVFPLVVMAYLSLDKTKCWPEKLKCLWPFVAGITGYLILRQYLGITDVHRAGAPKLLILGFVTFLRSVITDLRLFVFPVDLHYDRCLTLIQSLKQPQALATCFFWGAALIIFVRYYRKINPILLFLLGWFFIELLPVSQLAAIILVGAGRVSTAEHFLYLACIPVLTGMVMAFRWAYELNARKAFVNLLLLKFLAGGFLVFLLITAVEQSIYASNEFNMINRSLAFEPNNPRLQGAMGILSVFRKDIPDAEKYFRAAIKAEPSNPAYHIALGTALCQQGKWIEGLAHFVVFDPGKDKALVQHEEDLTMAHIRQELSQGKNFDARGWLTIGIYYAKTNQENQAIEAFLKSASLNPGQVDAWFNLGSLYEGQKNWPAARMAYKKLLALNDLTVFQRDFGYKHLTAIEGR
ncbi:MAG: tetratricopeptide repeat protein [Candidatus Omnitrophica bacterium]|nr:tetratricopeptide repeat protein [Candidatus Omnitrophota bacterium]